MPTQTPKRDPFGHYPRPEVAVKADRRFLHKYTYQPDHESLSYVLTDENVEEVDLVKLTQSYKNECGIEAMKILLASGQASPDDFADDGTGSADLTPYPTNINDAYQAANATKAAAKKSVESLGGSLEAALGSGKLDEYIQGLVSAELAKIKKTTPANEVNADAK